MPDRSTVLVLHSGHSNDLVYTEGLRAGLAPLGCHVTGIPVTDQGLRDRAIRDLMQNPGKYLCVISILFYGLQLKIDDVPLHRRTSVPFVLWLFDHPALFFNSSSSFIPSDPHDIVLAALDRSQIHYWHRFISADTPAVELNFGIGRHPELPRHVCDIESFRAREPIALLPTNIHHLGTSLDQIGDKLRRFSPRLAGIAFDAVDLGLRDLNVTALDVIEHVAASHGAELETEAVTIMTMLIDGYFKLWRRSFVLEQLLDLPVRFLGSGMPELHRPGRRHRFAETKSPEIFNDYRASQVVINIGPAFPHYLHERVLQGTDSGAAILSDEKPGLRDVFDKSAVAGYTLADGDVAERLTRLLDDPDAAYAGVVAAQRRMDEIDIHAVNGRRLFEKLSELRASGWRLAG
jgi:hypothetical protein